MTFASGAWTAKSDSQNRTLRTSLNLDAATGAILNRSEFSQKGLIDRISGVGIATHEGQLRSRPRAAGSV